MENKQDVNALYEAWKSAEQDISKANDKWLHGEIEDTAYRGLSTIAEVAKVKYLAACKELNIEPKA